MSVNGRIDPSALSRGQTTFADGSEGRVYTHPSLDGGVPSVTTVLESKEDPDKDEAIDGWREWYDGSSSRRSPHWLDQRQYKQWRGTLAHFQVAYQLDNDEVRGDEEDFALHRLKNWWAFAPHTYEWFPVESESEIPDDAFEEPSCPTEVFDAVSEYHQLRRGGSTHDEATTALDPSLAERRWMSKTDNSHRGRDAYSRVMSEVDFVGERFDALDDRLDIDEVVDVERYVLDEEWGYAGQFDMLFTQSDGSVVVGDLKTSSALRYSHKIQTAAYAQALDMDVDRLCVVRIYPDDDDVEVSFDDAWEMSKDGLTAEFLSLCDRTMTETLGQTVTEKGLFYDG